MKSIATLFALLGIALTSTLGQETSASAFAKRAYERRISGDRSAALDDYNKWIELAPNDASAYWTRGVFYFEEARFDLALADLRKSEALRHSTSDRAQLLIWTLRAQTGEREAADKELELEVAAARLATATNEESLSLSAPETFDDAASALENGKPLFPSRGSIKWKPSPDSAPIPIGPASRPPSPWDEWFLASARFLLGKITEREYFSAPPSFDKNTGKALKYWPPGKRSCEALFYAGVRRLAGGDKKKALQYFKECETAEGPSEMVERRLARTELKLLDKR